MDISRHGEKKNNMPGTITSGSDAALAGPCGVEGSARGYRDAVGMRLFV